MHNVNLLQPATIHGLREQGASALAIVCRASRCNHIGWAHFDRLDLDEATPLSTLGARRRFRCEKCRGRDVEVTNEAGARRMRRRMTTAVQRA